MRLPYKLLLAAPVVFFLYLYGLADVGLLGPDEPRYAAIGREMALSGDWITPRLWGEAWFEKPALLYWLIAVGNILRLGPELAARVPVAVVAVWFLLFYFLRLRREFGERAAWFATTILATTAGWLAFAHVAVTDIPLAASFSASMLLALPWVRSGGRRGLILAGALLGLAVLSKGLVPLILALPLFWAGRRRWADLLAFGTTALLVAAPWYLLCYLRNGSEFVDTLIWKHHFGRFFTSELQHGQPWWFYIPVLAGLLFPWTPALAALRGLDWREPRRLLLLSWFLFGLLFFSVSSNKLPGYLLPLLPAATALIGIQLAVAPIPWILPASSTLLCLVPVAAAVLPQAVVSGLRRSTLGEVYWAHAVAPIALSIVVFIYGSRRFVLNFAFTTLATAVAVVYLIQSSFSRLEQTASARQTWRAMVRNLDSECVNDVPRSLRYGLNYYAGHELPSCSAERNRDHDILDRDEGVRR